MIVGGGYIGSVLYWSTKGQSEESKGSSSFQQEYKKVSSFDKCVLD